MSRISTILKGMGMGIAEIIPGVSGGTIAFMMARYEMNVVDCGVGLLSMHAPWEAVGKLDVYMAHKGYHAFFKS